MPIPKVLYQTSKESDYPAAFKRNLDKFKQMNPSWDVRYFSDEDCSSFMKEYFPELFPFYSNLSLPVQKADVFRYAVIYKYGGFYADLDMNFKKPLDDLCNYDAVFAEETTIPETHPSVKSTVETLRIANYMFGAKPKHPFIEYLLNEIPLRKNLKISHEEDILALTGPAAVTELYHKYILNHNDIFLLANNGFKCPECGKISCHFGNYAVHLHKGSWRWEYLIRYMIVGEEAKKKNVFKNIAESSEGLFSVTESFHNIKYSTLVYLGKEFLRKQLPSKNSNILLIENLKEIDESDATIVNENFSALLVLYKKENAGFNNQRIEIPVFYIFENERLEKELSNDVVLRILSLVQKVKPVTKLSQRVFGKIKMFLRKLYYHVVKVISI